jgi:hypothetical protein
MTPDPVPVLDVDTIVRRLARGPDDCRRCGQPTVADQVEDVIVGRSCPHCGHAWTYPAPCEVTDEELAQLPPAHPPSTERSTPMTATTDPFAVDPWTPTTAVRPQVA